MSGTISRLNRRTGTPNAEPRVVRVGDEDADAVLDALSSETARALFEALHADPATPSEVADRIDTSVQNVHYHVTNLESAALIEPVDTLYSDKGNEMTVYGPASDPIVLVGDDGDADLAGLAARLAGGVGLLALASLLVQLSVEALVPGTGGPADVVWPASRSPATGERLPALVRLVVDAVEPGVLFFLGGLVVVAAVLWTRSRSE